MIPDDILIDLTNDEIEAAVMVGRKLRGSTMTSRTFMVLNLESGATIVTLDAEVAQNIRRRDKLIVDHKRSEGSRSMITDTSPPS